MQLVYSTYLADNKASLDIKREISEMLQPMENLLE